MKTIEIIVTRDGETTLQTLGFSGSSCREASQFLVDALGSRAGEYRTAEYYQAEAVAQHHRQQS